MEKKNIYNVWFWYYTHNFIFTVQKKFVYCVEINLWERLGYMWLYLNKNEFMNRKINVFFFLMQDVICCLKSWLLIDNNVWTVTSKLLLLSADTFSTWTSRRWTLLWGSVWINAQRMTLSLPGPSLTSPSKQVLSCAAMMLTWVIMTTQTGPVWGRVLFCLFTKGNYN